MPARGATPLGLGHTRISWLLVARAPNLGHFQPRRGFLGKLSGTWPPCERRHTATPRKRAAPGGPGCCASTPASFARVQRLLLRARNTPTSSQTSRLAQSSRCFPATPGDHTRAHAEGHRSRSRPQKAAQVSRARRVSGRPQEAPCSPGGRCGPGLAGPCLLHGEPPPPPPGPCPRGPQEPNAESPVPSGRSTAWAGSLATAPLLKLCQGALVLNSSCSSCRCSLFSSVVFCVVCHREETQREERRHGPRQPAVPAAPHWGDHGPFAPTLLWVF